MFSLILLSAMIFQENTKKTEFFTQSTDNFEIVSNNQKLTDYLANHIEFIKQRTYQRWGMEDISFQNKCMIVCIDDKNLYSDLYKRQQNGLYKPSFKHENKKISAIWLYMETDWRDSVLPGQVTEACLHEYSLKYNVQFPTWMIRGMARLNGSEKTISSLLANSHIMMQNFAHYDGENLLKGNIGNSDYDKWLDTESVFLCLFLKKEIKMKNIMDFCKKSPLLVVRDDLKFASFEEFNYRFEKYMFDLSLDIKDGKTPVSYYLDVFAEKTN